MPFGDNDPYSRSIETDLAQFRPLGDFVLVRPFSEREQLAMEDRTIAQSPLTMTRDGRYLFNRPRGLQYGTVVAMGAGDRVILLGCKACGTFGTRIDRGWESRKWRCTDCGGFDLFSTRLAPDSRAPMGCTLGEVIIFPRVPANEIRMNGEEFVVIHEEQHVYGVLEAAA